MASIIPKINKNGKLISYKIMVCVGRDENERKQIWRTKTFPRPEGFTPAKEKKEIERLALIWEQQQREEYEKGHTKGNKEKITFKEFVDNHWWKDHVEDGTHTPNTVAFYRYMVNDLIEYFGPKKKLMLIDAEDVKRYIKYCNTEAKTRKGESYSPTTTQHHFSTLRNILEYARRYKYIDNDPCQDLAPKERPQRNKKKIDFLEPDEARQFLNALHSEPLYWQAMMNLLITTGLRRGEAVGLQWADIDTEAQEITVQRNVTTDKESPDKRHIGETKSKEARIVPVSARVLQLLLSWKKEQEDRFHSPLLPTAFVFSSASDAYKSLYPTEVTRWQRKFVKKYNLKNVSPHDLRHTAATLALEGGANIKQVQQILGHSDPAISLSWYISVTEEGKRKTVESIEALLNASE